VHENPVCFFNLLQSRQTAIFIFDNNVWKHLYFSSKSFSVKTTEAENQAKIWAFVKNISLYTHPLPKN